MTKWNMIVDVAKCENCHNCTLSTKDEHIGNDFPGYAAPQPAHGHDWVRISRRVRGSGHMVDAAYLPRMCNHCDDAPCLRAGGADGAVRKRADGIVLIDPVKAKGRRDLLEACPYGAINWNEALELPQIWIFDAHLLDQGWDQPRASSCCPTAALEALKIGDAEMARKADAEGLEVLQPELGTRPRIYYRNLYRFTKDFLGGTIVARISERIECIEGAKVTLLKEGAPVDSVSSDIFGDFKFDGLAGDGSLYRIEAVHPQWGRVAADVVLDGSINAGELALAH